LDTPFGRNILIKNFFYHEGPEEHEGKNIYPRISLITRIMIKCFFWVFFMFGLQLMYERPGLLFCHREHRGPQRLEIKRIFTMKLVKNMKNNQS